MIRVDRSLAFSLVALILLLAAPWRLSAQSNTRLLLSAGSGVPGHPGIAFGPFIDLAMNDNRQIAFLSSLRSPRNELRAVVVSSGVSFSVVAFQGLQSPIPKTSYDSFSAPSLNDAGVICFAAGLKDTEGAPSSAIIRVDGSGSRALVTSTDTFPGTPDANFLEFSAPLVNSQGNILFGARWGGKKPGTGLFLWTPRGLQRLDFPAGISPMPKDLFEPIFFNHDEAALALRGTPWTTSIEQFFRAVAIRSFQEIVPVPDPAGTVQLLAPRPGQAPVNLVLVIMEGENVQTALLAGDPSQPVMARHVADAPEIKPLGQVEGQTTSAQGNIIFAATPLDSPDDIGLYCYCAGQVTRLTSADDLAPIVQPAPGKPILSLVGDSQQTTAFIAPGAAGGGSAIYVTSIP
ncbi:exported hypothetical protein [Acidobacteriia bacterium SbA2]|nr:exported hypothetical protein [Acidobacteriia bacterium SbA2]